jgi:hypothetical protein
VYLPASCKMARLAATPEGRKIEEVMRGGRIAADVALGVAAAIDATTTGGRDRVPALERRTTDETHRKKALA